MYSTLFNMQERITQMNSLNRVSRMFSDPLRTEILEVLTKYTELCVQDIQEELAHRGMVVSQPNVSQQLRKLLTYKLVNYNRLKQYRIYYITKKNLYVQYKEIAKTYEKG